MNEVESALCCPTGAPAECCKNCVECPCLSVRTANSQGQTIVPGAKVSLAVSFDSEGSFQTGGGSPAPGCSGLPCCCYDCAYYPFGAFGTYECTGIGSDGCGCLYTFVLMPDSSGEQTPTWFKALPDIITLFCGPGEGNPCLPDGGLFCPKCPPGTDRFGQKAHVLWSIGVGLPQTLPNCVPQNAKCCTACLAIGCGGPFTLPCSPSVTGPKPPAITPPCDGECSGGTASTELWICSSFCNPAGSGCWKKIGTLTAAWAVVSTGGNCTPTGQPCESCLP